MRARIAAAGGSLFFSLSSFVHQSGLRHLSSEWVVPRISRRIPKNGRLLGCALSFVRDQGICVADGNLCLLVLLSSSIDGIYARLGRCLVWALRHIDDEERSNCFGRW
jgi:hypothetical protein